MPRKCVFFQANSTSEDVGRRLMVREVLKQLVNMLSSGDRVIRTDCTARSMDNSQHSQSGLHSCLAGLLWRAEPSERCNNCSDRKGEFGVRVNINCVSDQGCIDIIRFVLLSEDDLLQL